MILAVFTLHITLLSLLLPDFCPLYLRLAACYRSQTAEYTKTTPKDIRNVSSVDMLAQLHHEHEN